MESFNLEITNVVSLDPGSVEVMDCNQILQETEMEVDNDALIFQCSERAASSSVTEKETEMCLSTASYVRNTKTALHDESNKSQEIDKEIIQITAGLKEFTAETVIVASEDFIEERSILLSDDPSSDCQNALRHFEVDGSSHYFDIQRGNIEVRDLNMTKNKYFFPDRSIQIGKTNFPSKKSEECITSNTTTGSTDPNVSSGSGDCIKKAMSHSELSTEEEQQCSLCWKWSTSESLFKRHILWHFFIKNCSDSKGCGVKCDASVFKEKSLEELMRSFELEFCNSQDIVCWNCHRNYEIHFSRNSSVNSESEPLKCPLCTNTFRCKIRLQIHMRVHLSRSPYKCCICKLDFPNTGLLIKHMNRHKQFGGFSNVCDTLHKVYPSGSADERNLETALSPEGVANHHFGRASRIEELKQSCILSDVCDTSHNIYPSGSADERNLEAALSPKSKEDLNVTKHHCERVSSIEEEDQMHSTSDINDCFVLSLRTNLETEEREVASCNSPYDHAKEIISCKKADRYVKKTMDFMLDEGSAVTSVLQRVENTINLAKGTREEHHFGSASCIEEEDLMHSTSDAKTINDHFVLSFRANVEAEEKVASCNSAYDLAKEIISCKKVNRYMNKAMNFMLDEGSAMTRVLQKLEYCINLSKGTRDISETQSDQSCNTLGDLSEMEAVLKTVMLTSYGSILADLDRSLFWCKICATPFRESAEFQIHKSKFCTGRKKIGVLNHLRNKTGKRFQYKCFMCNRYFYNQLKRYDHMVFHFALLLKRCPVCTKHFESLTWFIDHLLTHPLMENNLFKCSECNKYFCDEKSVAIHFQRMHTVRKPYKCETCNREFFKGTSFAVHVKGHLKNKWRKSLIGMDMYKPPKQYLYKNKN